MLEPAVGTATGIEVKATETVRAEDFRGLHQVANPLGDRFRAGIVLYAGEQQLSFGDRLTALPWPLCGGSTAQLPEQLRSVRLKPTGRTA